MLMHLSLLINDPSGVTDILTGSPGGFDHAGFIDILNGKALELRGLASNFALLGAMAAVIVTYVVSRDFMKTFGALLLAGVFVWGVNNVQWFQDQTDDEFRGMRAPIVVEVESSGPWVSHG